MIIATNLSKKQPMNFWLHLASQLAVAGWTLPSSGRGNQMQAFAELFAAYE